MTIDLTWSLAGQLLVSIILGGLIGGGLALAGVSLFKKSLSRRDEVDEIVETPSDLTPDAWIPADNASDDDEHEDFEHMRVVREHGAGSALEHRSIPYRRITT